MQKKKVLIIRFNSIGDIILISPVVKLLYDSGYQVDFLVKKNYSAVLEHNPYLNNIHLFEGQLSECVRKLQTENYTYIIDLHNNLRSNLLSIRLPFKTLRLKKDRVSDFLMVNFGFGKTAKKHIVNRFVDVVKPIVNKFELESIQTDYYYTQDYDTTVLPEDYIAISVATAFETKNIPLQKLVDLINEVDANFVLLGAPKDIDKAEYITGRTSREKVISLVGECSLNQTAHVIYASRFIISGDSGLMHMAAALKKPVVAIFGSTHPLLGYTPFYGLKNIEHYLIQNNNISCRPCTRQGRNTCPKGHFKCMNDISVDEIRLKVEQLLEK